MHRNVLNASRKPLGDITSRSVNTSFSVLRSDKKVDKKVQPLNPKITSGRNIGSDFNKFVPASGIDEHVVLPDCAL